jgi:RNA polymerase sigma-70 factor (sigma-E family)
VSDTFEDFVLTRGTRLARFAYVLCGNHHLAEDLVQEVLARLHPRWSKIDRDVSHPEAYVRTAIVREYLSWRRRRMNSEASVADVPEALHPGPDSAQRQAERDELWRALSALPRSQRAVLVLRFYEDLSDARIAEVLGCRAVTVRGYAMRGLAQLRTALRKAIPDRSEVI